MMRITPLCIWAHRLSEEDLIVAISEETKLTHPNESAVIANVGYAIVI
jgi:ADP-ribosylglycohydrolase